MRTWLSLTVVVLLLALPARVVTAGIPDPNLSTCGFPEGTTLCSDPVTISVQVNNSIDEPIDQALVQVVISLVSGLVDPAQPLMAEAWTNADGEATVVFPDGVAGSGIILFELYAMGIKLCESEEYTVLPACPVPTQPVSWGLVKALYR